MAVNPICEKCSNLLFDEHWGEYKCLWFQRRLYDLEGIVSCEHKNKPRPKRRKKNDANED